MTKKSNSHFPKTLRINGLEIPLSFSFKDTKNIEDSESKNLKTDASAKAFQEIDSEHGHSVAMTTLLHDALLPLLGNSNNDKNRERLLSMLTEVANTDTKSEHGKRSIKVGLSTEAGQLILEQFRFTPNCTDFDALDGKAFFDWKTQEMTFKDISLDWMFPSPTTHFELTVGIVSIDFEKFAATLHPLSYYLFIPDNGKTHL